MNFEDLKIIWDAGSERPSYTLDEEALHRIVRKKAHSFWKKILFRDSIEIGVAILLVYQFSRGALRAVAENGGAQSPLSVSLFLMTIGVAFVGLFLFVSRQRQKKREMRFEESIQGNLQKLHSNVSHQIHLLSHVAWWYLLPLVPGVILFIAATADEGEINPWLRGLIVAVIFGGILWLNLRAVRTTLRPQQRELESLLAALENGGQDGEIRSALTEEKLIPLSRRIFALILALGFLAAGWILFSVLKPVEEPREPTFENVSAYGESEIGQVDAWLQEQVERCDHPSLSVAAVRDGEVVYQRAFGFEDTWEGRAATDETAYHVASVTKAFTASLAMLLHERGVIDLDQPVLAYLPKEVKISTTPEVGATITLRQLATHTSGMPRGVPGPVQSVEGRYDLEAQRLYDHLAKVGLEFDPGTNDLYSNLGFGLLGHALERAAKKPLNQLLQEMLCEPLQLERTAYHVDAELAVATGYTTPPQLPEAHSYRDRMAGSGGLVTSVGDLAKFLAAQMKPGLFTSEMLAQMHAKTKMKNGTTISRALGWSIDLSRNVGLVLSKNGGRGNASAWMGFMPDHGVGVAVITNIGEPDVDSIGRWLLERSVPGARTPTSKHGYAKVAPFTGVRWEKDRPLVQVEDRWYPLISIDGIPMDRIVAFAQEKYGQIARKRFAEDLPEVLSSMGHDPDWEVTLGLEGEDGEVELRQIKMTEHNRNLVRKWINE